MAKYRATVPQSNIVATATKRYTAGVSPQTAAGSAERARGLTPTQQSTVRENALAEIQVQTRERLKDLMQRYANGKTSSDSFRTLAQNTIRRGVIAAAIVSVGGAANVTDSILSSIQSTISRQFDKIDSFVKELSSRKVTQRDRARFLNNSSTVGEIAKIATRQQSVEQTTSEEAYALSDSGYCPDCIKQIGSTVGNWYEEG